MHVEKITISYTRTINLGDYNQIKLSMMPTVYLNDGDDEGEILASLWQMCRANIEHAAKPIIDGYRVGEIHGITQDELFLGVPIETMEVTDDAD